VTAVPFQPVREDGRPYWQVIYDYLVARIEDGTLSVGDIIAHGVFADLLDGLPHYQPTSTAARHLREHHSRNLMVVRGVGYKLVAGMDMVGQAKSLQRKGNRTIGKAVGVVKAVDHSLLSPEERVTTTQVAKGLAVLAGYVKMTALKLADHEQEIELLKSAKSESNSRHRATEEDMTELRRRLEELEQRRTS